MILPSDNLFKGNVGAIEKEGGASALLLENPTSWADSDMLGFVGWGTGMQLLLTILPPSTAAYGENIGFQ
jgi:hypothetical protein